MNFSKLQKQVWQTVDNNGFHEADGVWENTSRTNERLMLVVTEVSEACEAVRHGDWLNFKEELADTVIRLMDIAECYEINLEEEILRKDAINQKRGHMHGGKRC